jgi:hypothetical protein
MWKKLSIIITGRNDNYDVDFDDRLIIALSHNLKNLPDAEFIFVEWNPYMDRPLVCDKLKREYGKRIKYYVAHPKWHEKYCLFDGFNEYPAKNIGIKRASGKFILSMNSDVILYPELANYIKNNDLKEGILYRAIRVDIHSHYRDVSFPLNGRYILEENGGPTNASGDFLLMDKKTWHNATGYCEDFPSQRLHKDSFIIWLLNTRQKLPLQVIGKITHWRHPSSWSNGFKRDKVGDRNWDFTKTGWTKNNSMWGLSFAREINRDGIIWLE